MPGISSDASHLLPTHPIGSHIIEFLGDLEDVVPGSGIDDGTKLQTSVIVSLDAILCYR
jgi:hypothetical protein